MRISRLKSWLSNPVVIVYSIGLVVLVLYMHVDRGMSFLKIAFAIPTVVALGILALALLFFLFTPIFFHVPEPYIYYEDGRYSVDVDFSSPLNRGVLEYLRSRPSSRKAELESSSPANVKNPLAKTNTHPEAGVRLWVDLAASLPVDCRWIIYGTPALVHPKAGVLFGVAFGTMYCLRLSEADKESALEAGVRTEHEALDLESQFGPDWVFGNWAQVELEWCRAEYEALGRAAADEATPENGVPR
jgi:hypothetical protein